MVTSLPAGGSRSSTTTSSCFCMTGWRVSTSRDESTGPGKKYYATTFFLVCI